MGTLRGTDGRCSAFTLVASSSLGYSPSFPDVLCTGSFLVDLDAITDRDAPPHRRRSTSRRRPPDDGRRRLRRLAPGFVAAGTRQSDGFGPVVFFELGLASMHRPQ